MNQQRHDQSPTLEEIREKFEYWRQSRKKRTKIPQHLWSAAVKLSENHSVGEISKALRLNFTDLQKRIQQSQSNCLPEMIQPNFIGLDVGQSESAEYVIEMAHHNGDKMKAHITGAKIDFIELSKVFFGGPR